MGNNFNKHYIQSLHNPKNLEFNTVASNFGFKILQLFS
jgi:hypothetical protein